MAESPSHRFGQMIGHLVEQILYEPLRAIADRHDLYLDTRHPRAARGGKSKVSWRDNRGNAHDLDFVLEKGGSETVIGSPKAFIETAWRRYTKHSRNKAQEIQGAIIPLAETYGNHFPFLGVVLAGVFTKGSIQQLRSHGFSVLYYPYDVICQAFASVGIDASFGEGTSDAELATKIAAYQRLSNPRRRKLARSLAEMIEADRLEFLQSLELSLLRHITQTTILTLHGASATVKSIDAAVALVEIYDESLPVDGFVRYEMQVKYSNGDQITCSFVDKRTALMFLHGLR